MNNAALKAVREIAAEFVNPKFQIVSHQMSTASRPTHHVEKLIDGEWKDISGPLSTYAAACELRNFELKYSK